LKIVLNLTAARENSQRKDKRGRIEPHVKFQQCRNLWHAIASVAD